MGEACAQRVLNGSGFARERRAFCLGICELALEVAALVFKRRGLDLRRLDDFARGFEPVGRLVECLAGAGPFSRQVFEPNRGCGEFLVELGDMCFPLQCGLAGIFARSTALHDSIWSDELTLQCRVAECRKLRPQSKSCFQVLDDQHSGQQMTGKVNRVTGPSDAFRSAAEHAEWHFLRMIGASVDPIRRDHICAPELVPRKRQKCGFRDARILEDDGLKR